MVLNRNNFVTDQNCTIYSVNMVFDIIEKIILVALFVEENEKQRFQRVGETGKQKFLQFLRFPS